ncbi:MAG TPA: fibronectin type III domain-containing protein [Verrucomicrobiae bacterium]|nr:fibronectin type III domain-containing protein [Verrucomicrobiae bacterium]
MRDQMMMRRCICICASMLFACGLSVHALEETNFWGPAENTAWRSALTPSASEGVEAAALVSAKAVQQSSAAATPNFSPITPSAHQPVGALSGRVVFMNSGHGWTWYTNGSSTNWGLQRPSALNSMNEDYGNWDQLNFFAAYCFNAGAIVASMRPLGQQTNEVIIDNVDAGVAFAGTWNNSSQTVYWGKPGAVPYRFASFAATETATATYTPTIPVAGYYPVYTWVLHGTDRGDQLYRIRHTGGETLYRVPHYLVGNGWVYLGEYYFNAGSNSASGSVVVSNLRGTATGSVVIADAIRFGNGMGSVNRGSGVSGYPREEESCRYWIQGNLGQGQSTSLFETSGNDEQDSWSAPPRMSVEMTETSGTSFFKRIHISFHSNASTGVPATATSRGVNGLVTTVPTPNQAELARLCGQTVNDEMVSLGSPPLEFPWFNSGTNIVFSGAYGELSDNSFLDVMDATIIEVAYHDNPTDAALLRDPRVRNGVARAAMHAVVKYMNEFDTNNPPPLIYLPEPPVNVRAIGAPNGTVALTWAMPVSVANSGAPTNYIIYQSTNGYGFGNPISVGNVTNYTVSNLATGVDYYFRVAAGNAGGESFPSAVVGCRPPATGTSIKALFVNGFDRFDRTTDLNQDLVAQHYVPPGPTGGNQRVLPRRINSFDYVVPHGKALSAYGMAFDSCQHGAITNDLVSLTNYPIVIWEAGNESTADETFSSIEETKVATFLAGGGNLFVSGAEIAWDLDRPSGPTAADRNFFHNQLHAVYVADSSGAWNFNAAGTSLFAGNMNGTFDDGSKGVYMVGFPDVIAPTNYGTLTGISYSNVTSGAAAVVYNGTAGGGKVVYLGFPFETILSEAVRNVYMADVLNFFTAGPLKFDAITGLAGGQVKVDASGAAGIYTVQTSADLSSWGALMNLTNTSGVMSFTNDTTSGVKFYRVKSFP